MKLGLGLYKGSLNTDNFKFARQAGATHLVVHLVDYFQGKKPSLSRGDEETGWGITRNQDKLWNYEDLMATKKEIEAQGLKWEAIENFDPSHWYDVLLDGPLRVKQIEDLKKIIRTVGRVGIPIIGYNFSIAGVWGWTKAPVGRGEAVSLVFDQDKIDIETPIPEGMVWNMIYDPEIRSGYIKPVSEVELWQRLESFLTEVLPVAEESGVKLALHPDDPPVERLRSSARLVNQPSKYKRLVELATSPANCLEYCMGSVQEMREGNLYESLDYHSKRGDIGYIHFRNVKGKVPHYQEVFVDEGDIDMLRAIKILKKNNYHGVLIPDHTPEMSCDAPWHAGMSYALGYIKGLMHSLED